MPPTFKLIPLLFLPLLINILFSQDCDENMYWTDCGLPFDCNSTCLNPDPPPDCITLCEIGCFCNEGYIFSNDSYTECILIEDCAPDPQIGDECILDDGGTGFLDCELCCWDTGLLAWLGDGWCDDMGGCWFEGPQYDCLELGYDCGDCNDVWDGNDPSGFCEGNLISCGDGYCSGDETVETCPEDCGIDMDCSYCDVNYYQYYGGNCCDVAWEDEGYTCAFLESYYWDCTGCLCPGDNNYCGDNVCSFEETEENCLEDCETVGNCNPGYVLDCTTNECVPEMAIGNGTCNDGSLTWDLTCYDNDGGDCNDSILCEDQGLVTCPDGDCAGDISYCTENCDEGYVEDCHDENDCLLESWIGDGYPDCWPGTMWDLACYDNDGGDCDGYTTCEMQGLITCPNGECVESLDDCSDSTECVEGYVTDCSGDGDCCWDNWIGDGWADCSDQQYGCDLTCYDCDGGDCPADDPGCVEGDDCYVLYDTNNDGVVNILDVIEVVNYILGGDDLLCPLNDDGVINVLDIVIMVNIILEGNE